MLRGVALIFALGLASAASAAPMADTRCQVEGGEPVEVVDVDARLELRLADGRLLVLAGIEPPAGTLAKDQLADWLFGKEVVVQALASQPDRWGRLPAIVFTSGARESAAEALLRAGLARIRISGPLACLAALRAAETLARDNGEGVWAQEATVEMDAADLDAFRGRDGASVVVTGRAVSVATLGYRTYVNFGPRKYRDFSITILKPSLKIFDKAGLSVQSLSGHQLRVRGMLDMQFGPQIEIASPDAIEILD